MSAAVSDALSTAIAQAPASAAAAPVVTPVAESKPARKARVIVSAPPKAAMSTEDFAAAYEFDNDDAVTDTTLEAAPAVEETPAEVAPVEQAPAHKHSQHLASAAKRLGATQEQIDATDPDTLAAWVDGGIAARQQPSPRQDAARTDARGQDAPAVVDRYAEDLKALDEAGVSDEPIAKLTKKLIAELAEVRADNATLKRAEQNRAVQSEHSVLDNAFDAIGSEKLFGKGAMTAMTKDNPAAQRRAAVMHSLQISPIPGMSIDKAIAARAKALFGIDSPAPAPVAAKPAALSAEQWKDGALAAPTARRTQLPKGPALAAAKLAETYGLPLGDAEDEEP